MNTQNASRIIISSAIIIGVIFWSCQNTDKDIEVVKPQQESAIKPPFPHIKLASTDFNVNPKKDTVLALSDGSELIIKANSFIDKSGNPIEKPVKVSYTPMRDAASIMASGVPMQFKDPKTGKQGSFESAGMFRLDASAEGTEVEIDKTRPIIAELASNEDAGGYANYFFNERVGKWEEIAPETIRKNEDKAEVKKELDALKSKTPFGDKNYFVLNGFSLLDIELWNNNNLWNILNNSSLNKLQKKYGPYGIPIYGIDSWGTVNYNGNYYYPSELVWENLSNTPFPAWAGKNYTYDRSNRHYAMASKISNNEYLIKVFEDQKTDTTVIKAKIVMTGQQLLGNKPIQWLENSAEIMAQIQKLNQRYEAFAAYKRTLSIDQNGIYNCDRLYNNPAARHTTLDIQLLGENVKATNPEKIYLISTLYNNALELNFSDPFVLPIEEDKTARLVTVYSDLSIAEVDNQQLLSAYHHAANSKEPFKISFKRLVKPRTLEDLHAALAQK
ncbi:MAG: hypothetical protein ACK5CY_06005 [Bacteroidia bacterium]|jgi:hypothetical protein